MDVRTYRAANMHEALERVRRDLGPDAVVLQTRDVRSRRLFGLLAAGRQIEVTASAGVNVPSRFPSPRTAAAAGGARTPRAASRSAFETGDRLPSSPPAAGGASETFASRTVSDAQPESFSRLQGLMRDFRRQPRPGSPQDLPDALFRLFTDLIEVDADENTARELVERVRHATPDAELADPILLKARLEGLLESSIKVTGPIQVVPGGRRLVALVGPTGVGKTTTIAKLAANHRLKLRQNVGLITVDTYRIAAVEQLRTYADIIDLPMQVVSTPREMREAVRRLSGLDLILMDTAGRSPRDEIKIQELKAFLAEAGADEVHLVLGSGAGSRSLLQAAEHFAAVGTTAMILTKLDEASGLGNLIPLLQASPLPISYVTNGQNVPDDIETAESARLANLVLSGDLASKVW